MGRFQRSSQFLSAALVAVSLAIAGCGASPDSEPAAAAQQGVQKYRGVVGKVGAALNEVELRADQRTAVDGLLQEVDAKAGPVREAKDELGAAVLEGIRAGKLDKEKIDARVEVLKKAALGLQPTIEASLTKLHATLDAGQREDLLDALRERMESDHEGRRGGLKAIAEELKLTDEQRDQIIALVKGARGGDREGMRERFKEGRARGKEMADAFVSDKFDAKSFGFGERIEKMTNGGVEKFLRVASEALPVLTAEQRSKLADIVERRLEKLD